MSLKIHTSQGGHVIPEHNQGRKLCVGKRVTPPVRQAPCVIITVDQSLFALAKAIQWMWPIVYGEDKFVLIFGGLHLEMTT